MSKYISTKVKSQKQLTDDIFEIEIYLNDKISSEEIKAGQFCSVYVSSKDCILPRPISICKVNKDSIVLVYRVVGKGTKWLSDATEGTDIHLLMPLGNGFTLVENQNVVLVAGGIGIPPMVELAEQLQKLNNNVTVVLGYTDEAFIEDKFSCKKIITSDSGLCGLQGNVIDGLKLVDEKIDTIYSCGPMRMLEAVSNFAKDSDTKAYLSLEARMACSIGACVGCVVKINNEFKKVCVDGPVFDSEEVVFNG